MKKLQLCKLLLVFVLILLPALVAAQITGPIVSVADLEKNLTNPNVVVLDVRKVEEYREDNDVGIG